jgi:glutathione peroxidase
MMRINLFCGGHIMRQLLLAGLALVCLTGFSADEKKEEAKVANSVLDFTLDNIDGKPHALSQHKGEALLIVNVASKCGATPQYAALQALHTKYHDKGLTVIGVPANEFGSQEPGDNAEIKTFCTSKYSVTFPMMAKVAVKGDKICPLYKYLTVDSPKPGPITWNFNKFLVGRDGKVVERFDTKVKPDDAAVTAAIEKALAAEKTK